MNRCLGSWLLVCLVTTGCGTTAYEPARSPRIAMVSGAYVRDGTRYSAGFASGLEEAVRGNPRAEDEARSAHGLMIGGFVVTIAGATAAGTGAAVWATGVRTDDAGKIHSTSQSNIGAGVFLGGFLVECIGVALSNSGRAHELDAINIYNDGVSLPAAQPPSPRPLGDAAPAVTQ